MFQTTHDPLSLAADLRVAAMHHEMRTAARELATLVREALPEAGLLRFCLSDQGDWLCLDGWAPGGRDPQWRDVPYHLAADPDELRYALPRHLDARADLGPIQQSDGGPVPGLWEADYERGEYEMNIDTVLRGDPPGPAIEVLAVRDPDGADAFTLALGGEVVPAGAVTVHQVDAGAGWDRLGWAEHRDRCLDAASEAMRPLVREAFDSPPGSEHIDP